MTALTGVLANWSGNYGMAFPAIAIERAETAILDTVGCMLAGALDASVVGAAKLAADEPGGKAASVGHVSRITATSAALVNACAAHALDFDDNFFPAITHASAVLVPALFALAEECGATPGDIVNAYIVGLEVEAQIGKLLNPSHYESGWHATSTIGTIGAAAACARLLRLEPRAITHAISIGASLAGGSKKQFGSMVKPLHAGFAAMHGVMAAKLAAAGIEGDENILQGKWSFEELFAGYANGGDFEPALSTLLFPHAPLAIEEFGLTAKLYPSCMSSHLAIDAILALREGEHFDASAIETIDIHLPSFMVENLRYPQPVDEMEARFSANFCAAVAACFGIPRLCHFTQSALALESIRTLMARVRLHVRESPVESRRLPWGGDGMVQVVMASGETITRISRYPKGCIQNPISPLEQRAKFFDCVEQVMEPQEAKTLYDALSTFSKVENVSTITRHLRSARR